ncbi:MAG: hypothetical protein LBD03_08160 [Methanobrevibacter sp.]|jgi:hypothetical protein|nr:hypothetical protein [Candidatus Methanovirga procula]
MGCEREEEKLWIWLSIRSKKKIRYILAAHLGGYDPRNPQYEIVKTITSEVIK